MLKAEELKILKQIAELIEETDADSYIRMTFAGVPEVCKRNIEDDFGDSPVQDWEEMRNMLCAERVAHDETKRMLAQAQELWKQSMDEVDSLRKQLKQTEDERDALSDCVDGNNEIAEKEDRIIRQLLVKASAEHATSPLDCRYGYLRAMREVAKNLCGMTDDEIRAICDSVSALEYVDISLLRNIADIKVERINDWGNE